MRVSGLVWIVCCRVLQESLARELQNPDLSDMRSNELDDNDDDVVIEQVRTCAPGQIGANVMITESQEHARKWKLHFSTGCWGVHRKSFLEGQRTRLC